MKVIELANDIAFKTVFLAHPNVLARYACSLLGVKYEDVATDLRVLNSEIIRNCLNEKGKNCDIVLQLNKNFILDIEMNAFIYKGLNERNGSYVFSIYSSNLGKREQYIKYLEKRIIQLDLNMSSPYEDPISKFSVQNNKGEFYLHDTFYIISVDIDKCKKLVYNNNNLDINYRFACCLTETDSDKISKLLGDDFLPMEEKDALLDTIEEVNEDLMRAINRDDREKVEEAIMMTRLMEAEEKGLTSGYEKGLQKGIAEGIEQGIEQGKEDNQIKVIKAMLKENIDIDTISKVTGKTILEINNIKENLS